MTGFVIGKFCPPHLGHDHLIKVAREQVDDLTIVVCGKKSQAIDPLLRLEWLTQAYPKARVLLLNQDSFDDTQEEAWTMATKAVLGTMPDLMFSSETYGDHYAQLLGCRHILVDKDRLTVPVSASKILENPREYQGFLLPEARSYFQ
jgi:NadR type nicotinamide-nucleotide adenylyltransferase